MEWQIQSLKVQHMKYAWSAPGQQSGPWRHTTSHTQVYAQGRQLTRSFCVLITLIVFRLHRTPKTKLKVWSLSQVCAWDDLQFHVRFLLLFFSLVYYVTRTMKLAKYSSHWIHIILTAQKFISIYRHLFIVKMMLRGQTLQKLWEA